VGRVELLGHAHERDIVPLEGAHQACEVQQRPAEAVDLVDHHGVDLAGLDVGHQPPQRRAFGVAAAVAPVVVALRQADPPLVPLGGDERLGGLALRVQGVERLVQALLG
jgi:hypothetical protein